MKSGVLMFKSFAQVEMFFIERKKYGVKPGLTRIKTLLHLLGNPQDKIKAVHIAGTNGKGSTMSFLNQALIYNQHQVGVFTSPSIDGLTGHIFINDEKISEEEFIKAMNKIYSAITILDNENNHPTEFEVITALAFYYFVDSVDIALIETGMGGRDDTTNCFQPILSIITSIDKDHTEFLGENLSQIASHKAGIIKEKIPVICGEMNKEAYLLINQVAKSKQAPFYQIERQFSFEILMTSMQRQKFNWRFSHHQSIEVKIQTIGKHQIHNCSLALMALKLIKNSHLPLDNTLILKGIASAKIPGRFEVIHENPRIILDGAHNPAGIKSFVKTVDSHFGSVDKHLIFGAFKDKDINQMLNLLTGHFSKITLTSFDHPRAASVDWLLKNISIEEIKIESDWHSLLDKIRLNSHQKNSYYFFTGSLNFIAQVRSYFDV